MRTMTYPGPICPVQPIPSPKIRPVQRPRPAWGWIARWSAFIALASFLACMIAIACWTAGALRGLDGDLRALVNYQPGQATLIYASDGSLLATVAKEDRLYVSLDGIPVNLRNATIAAEDRRFWNHHGVDFRGLIRALFRDIRTGRASEGGSTLTMQLVRNVQLSPEKTLRRKVREAGLAIQLERVYTKPQILEMYLNQVFYGDGAYGVGAAAHTYFGRSLERLTTAQCALLATLPRRPTDFSPFLDPKGSLDRRNTVLHEMADQGYLTQVQLARSLREPLGVVPRQARGGRAPYFVDAVVDRLIDLYGPKAVYQGGLRVYATVNPAMQSAAEHLLSAGIRRLRDRRVTEGALVCIDPYTGCVKALVGGADYKKSPFDRALHSRRQPGSAFKPFVYAAVLDTGVSPLDKITDSPMKVPGDSGAAWTPNNDNHRFAGQTTLVNAFAQSMNIPAVKLELSVGIEQVAEAAESCGIRSSLRRVPSLALGTSEVTPLELTSAYGVFATQGRWAEPKMIRKVTTADGRLLNDFDTLAMQSVMDPLTARKVDYLLRAVVDSGTGRSVEAIPHARGKTGTTQEDRDAWFVGYTPELVTGIWLGNDAPTPMRGVWGGNGCGPIWRGFMERAVRDIPSRPALPFYAPPKPPPSQSITAAPLAATNTVLRDAPEWTPAPAGAPDASNMRGLHAAAFSGTRSNDLPSSGMDNDPPLPGEGYQSFIP